jgi:C4-dicarboxylate-specific signal transduction histidine kinase
MEPKLQSVRAYRNQIEQVIMNLAVNSRDAKPAGGELRIDAKNVNLDEGCTRLHAGAKVGRYVCLSVTDTGSGMDAETLAHIFEPFFTTKEMGKGTGRDLPRFMALSSRVAVIVGGQRTQQGRFFPDCSSTGGGDFRVASGAAVSR